MKEDKNLDSVVNSIDPNEFVSEIQKLVEANNKLLNRRPRKHRKSVKKANEKVKPYSIVKKVSPAVFSTNMAQFDKKEIVVGQSLVDNSIIKTTYSSLVANNEPIELPEVPQLEKKFFVEFTAGDAKNIIHPYQEYIITEYKYSNGKFPEMGEGVDERYVYDVDFYEKARKYSMEEGKDSIVFYQGNSFVNGSCVGTYTGFLENAGKIDYLHGVIKDIKKDFEERETQYENTIAGLEDRIKSLEEALGETSKNVIYKSEFDGSSNTTYLWTGSEDDYKSILEDPNNRDLIKQTTFITAED